MFTRMYIRKLRKLRIYWKMRDWICDMREKLPQRFHHLGPKEPCTCYKATYRCYK